MDNVWCTFQYIERSKSGKNFGLFLTSFRHPKKPPKAFLVNEDDRAFLPETDLFLVKGGFDFDDEPDVIEILRMSDFYFYHRLIVPASAGGVFPPTVASSV